MIELTSIRLKHTTKDYHIFIVKNKDTGDVALVRRWGAIGSIGQIKIMKMANENAARSYALKIVSDKQGRDYALEGSLNASRVYADGDEMMDDPENSDFKGFYLRAKGEKSKHDEFGHLNSIVNAITEDDIKEKLFGTKKEVSHNLEFEKDQVSHVPVNPFQGCPAHYGAW